MLHSNKETDKGKLRGRSQQNFRGLATNSASARKYLKS